MEAILTTLITQTSAIINVWKKELYFASFLLLQKGK